MRQLTHIQHSALLRTSAYAHIQHNIRPVAAFILRHDVVYLLLAVMRVVTRCASVLLCSIFLYGFAASGQSADTLGFIGTWIGDDERQRVRLSFSTDSVDLGDEACAALKYQLVAISTHGIR